MQKKPKKTIFCYTLLFILTGLLLMLAGCSSGTSDETLASPAGTEERGELVVGLTDAEGDFTTYKVEVLSLTLTKANGDIVETLPISTEVDFAQYVEMTEFVTAATIPSGQYVRADIVLDYQNADIRVENSAGDEVQVTEIKDEDGNDMVTLTASVHLENANALFITRGIPAYLTLDFDLNASNQVVFNESGDPEVTVEPVLLAEVTPEEPKVHRLRGPLKSVDVEEDSFRVIIRPFRHLLSGNNEDFGTLNVVTNDETVFDLSGDIYTGHDGIVAMDDLTALTATVVVGEMKFRPCRFEATEVYTGSSVPGGTMDAVTGNVLSRIDNTIVVKGATLVRTDGSVIFRDEVTVSLADTTTVRRQLSDQLHEINEISVGQRITVFGTLNDSDIDSLAMDASEGYALILLTTLRGTALQVAPLDETAQLVVDLQSIDARCIDLFDFAGTGVDIENDADPDNYEIATGTLTLDAVQANLPVKVRGFVRPFGQAPADFEAQTVVNVAAKKSFMKIKWHPPAEDAFESLTDEEIVPNLESATLFHHLGRGRVVVDLNDLAGPATIKPGADGSGLFVISWRGGFQLFDTFESFVGGLTEELEDGLAVNKLYANGYFDDATATLTTQYITVQLQ